MRTRLHSVLNFVLLPFRRKRTQAAIAAWTACESTIRSAFFDQAGRAGIPRGLRWKCCEWSGPTRFAHDRATGRLVAFVGVTVHFEAIEGDEMDGVEAVALPRDATAIFQHERSAWTTAGRTLFNMAPDEALDRLAEQFEPIDR